MFWGIITSALSALNTIIYKKLLVLNTKNGISSIGLYGYMCLVVVVMIGVLYVISPTYVSIDLSPLRISLIAAIGVVIFSVLGMLANLPAQIAYKEEKISVLTPFGETGRIITLILGFFFFSNTTTLTTFGFALISATALVLSGINFKSFSINKYCGLILLTGVIQAINTIIAGYIILQLSSFSFVLAINIIAFVCAFLYMLGYKRGELVKIPKQTTWSLMRILTINNLIWLITYVITLFLMKELGVVMTSLLGMLTMVLTMISGYIFFRDIPTRKDIVVATIIICSIIGGSVL